MSRPVVGGNFTVIRRESDTVEILSGVFEGKTTGTPISMMVWNKDQHSADYSEIASYYRPGLRRSKNFWISSSQRLSPAGQPSTTTPMPLPWDSPHVVIRNKLPNDEPAINASLKTLIF